MGILKYLSCFEMSMHIKDCISCKSFPFVDVGVQECCFLIGNFNLCGVAVSSLSIVSLSVSWQWLIPIFLKVCVLCLSVDICPHGMSSSSEANRLSSAGLLAISASIEGLVVRSPSSFTSVLSAMMISRGNSQARLEFRSFQWTSSVATMLGYVEMAM